MMKILRNYCLFALVAVASAVVNENEVPFDDRENTHPEGPHLKTFIEAHHGDNDFRQLQQQAEQQGDFDRFNELFKGASISIPNDFEVSERVALITLTLYIDNISCYDISVGNIIIDHTKTNTDIDVNVDITDLDMICDVNYRYNYGLLHGTGVAQVITDNNSAATILRFQSEDYQTKPPSKSSVQNCVTDIEITNIKFQDDFASDVVELFEKWIRDLVEGQIEAVACSELGSLGTTFIQDMLEVADKTLQGYQKENLSDSVRNPLYLEETTLLSDVEALNLQDTDTMVGYLFNETMKEIDSLLGTVVPDPQNPNDKDLGVNIMLRSNILDEDRALVVDADQLGMDAVLFEGHDKLTQSKLTLNRVKVFGLDSLKRFDPLNAIGKYTLQNHLIWEYLTLEFDVTVDIKPSTLEDAVLQDATSTGITERIKINFGVQNVDVDASLYVIIDQEALGAIKLGSLLFMDNLLPCLVSMFRDVQLSGLHVDPQSIDIPTLNGFVSPGLDRFITGAVEAAFDMYSGALEKALPTIFQTTVRNFVNGQIMAQYTSEGSSCPQVSKVLGGFVDFRDLLLPPDLALQQGGTGTKPYGDLAYTAMKVVKDSLLSSNEEGLLKINNAIISPYTQSQSGTEGTVVFEGNLFETGTSISVGGLNADITIVMKDAMIENLNTVTTPFALLETVATEPYYLNNTATIGTTESPLRVSTRFMFSIAGDGEDGQIRNDLEISLDMDSANSIVTAMLKVAESRLLGFPLKDIFDLNCWIAMIPAPLLDARGIRNRDSEVTASLAHVAATISQLSLNISCVECSSPGMLELTELLSKREAQDDATVVANSILEAITQLIGGDFLQVQIDRMLGDASKKCPHSPNYDPNQIAAEYQAFTLPENESDVTFLMLLGGVALALIVCVIFFVLSIRCFVRRRHKKWLVNLPADQVSKLQHIQQKEDAAESELNVMTRSMFCSEEVPRIVRWGMPVVILGNVALFLSGHLSLGATVNIEAQIAGETIRVEQFFEFSMAKSTVDIWNAGGKELAILILIFSGIWPYTKQLITLVLWFTPPSWVAISKRGSILLWLDWLAKWSMIDIFVLVISIAAFRVSIQSPGVAFLPEDFYSINLLVVPLWGLYANMIAQLVSQISSHFIIHYHRSIVGKAQDLLKQRHPLHSETMSGSTIMASSSCNNDYSKRLLRLHQFGRPHRGESEKLIVRHWVNYTVALSGCCLIAFVVGGCILPSFSLDIRGLIGVAVESGQEFQDATTYHSVFTVIQLLMEEAQFLGTPQGYIGLGTLSALFLITVLVVPILQTAALLIQWFTPLTTTQRSQISILTEILQAWQYAEVYLIAIFVASWQLGPVSQFMINSYCDSLDGFFAQMVYFGLLKEEDAQCFSVQSAIEEGAFILAAGAVALALINTFVTKAVIQYFRDKQALENCINEKIKDEKQEGSIGQYENNVLNISQTSVMQVKEDDAEADMSSKIHPVPVLFTDTFRWFLRQDDRTLASSRAFGVQFELPKSTTGSDGSEDSSVVDHAGIVSASKSTQSTDDGDIVVEIVNFRQSQNGNKLPPQVDGFYDDSEDEEESVVISSLASMDDGDCFEVNPVAVRGQSLPINNRPDEGDNAIL